ncbi:MAG: hypothetical protein NC131_07230 [Roseburia sp.]|nr:hypothetical protein [Roseburia sp.]
MTDKQRRELCALMFDDIRNLASAHLGAAQYGMMSANANALQSICIPPAHESGDELIARIKRERAERERRAESSITDSIARILTREELFRFSYVPFVIAELAWDYADTVLYCAQQLGNPITRKLSRAIRNARNEYDRLRRQFIDSDNREREIENGYVFEECTKHITSQLLTNIQCDIRSAYPELNDESRDLLIATYQCHITSAALLKYIERQRRMIERRLKRRVGDILPPSYYTMHRLIPEFIGDKPATEKFRKLMQQYIDTFATQIGLVELNNTEPENE